MPKISLSSSGKVLRRKKKVVCTCCQQLVVIYSWAGTGKADLDTNTVFLGESFGFGCPNSGPYSNWVTSDDTSVNGEERVNIRIDDAFDDELWSGTVNVTCKAGWYDDADGSGPATLFVKYRGKTSEPFTISPGTQHACASKTVATITVHATALANGNHFEIS